MTSRKFLSCLSLLSAVLVLPGCSTTHGRDFIDVPVATAIVPGVSTQADVIKLLGEPQTQSADTYRKDSSGKDLGSPLIVHSMLYFFSTNDISQPGTEPGVFGRRSMNFSIVNGVVAGMRRSSSFKTDSTEFDVSKLNQIKKGSTTFSEVIALIGKPSGTAVYPLAAEPGGQILLYLYNRFNVTTNTSDLKSLSVQVGSDQRVVDFNMQQETNKHPVARTPTPIVIPIYIPARR
jgi:outer membrane protein assembly factor BamE (lipoprotein component of BamABCDE complex)